MTYAVDTIHSAIGFAVRHMMISKVRGSFTDYSVDANINPADLSASKVSATIQLASIQTGDAQRDGHLKSADFFDVENNPAMTFTSTAIEKQGDGYRLTGDLSVKGTTKPVTFDVEVEGPARDPWGNTRYGFTLKGKLNREAFGLTWNQALETGGVLVGKDVELSAEIQLIQK